MKKNYPKTLSSPTTPGIKVDLPNYLVETILKKQSEKRKKRLNPKFWQEDEWKKIYSYELQACKNLLKTYEKSEDILQHIIESGELDTFYYPKARWIIQEHTKKNKVQQIKPKINITSTNLKEEKTREKIQTEKTIVNILEK